MANYMIQVAPAALRDLKKLTPDVQKQIAPVIDALATDPRPSAW